MLPVIEISEAKARFSFLVEKVLAGEEIIIGIDGKPLVKLVPFEPGQEKRKPGALRGK